LLMLLLVLLLGVDIALFVLELELELEEGAVVRTDVGRNKSAGKITQQGQDDNDDDDDDDNGADRDRAETEADAFMVLLEGLFKGWASVSVSVMAVSVSAMVDRQCCAPHIQTSMSRFPPELAKARAFLTAVLDIC
jgi:hypothetical protein